VKTFNPFFVIKLEDDTDNLISGNYYKWTFA